jgi:ABC-2 type transport system permease protein
MNVEPSAAVLAVSFWVTKVDGLQSLVEELLNPADLPISVYKGTLAVIFSYLIPLGVAATVPVGLLVGHPDPVSYLYAPACAVLTGALSQWVWRRTVGSYTNAGG